MVSEPVELGDVYKRQLCSKSISSDELGTLQENLIKSHACSVGEEIRPVIILSLIHI